MMMMVIVVITIAVFVMVVPTLSVRWFLDDNNCGNMGHDDNNDIGGVDSSGYGI